MLKGQPTYIDVSRGNIMIDSFIRFMQLSPEDLKHKLIIKFDGEAGLDYGGLARYYFHANAQCPTL